MDPYIVEIAPKVFLLSAESVAIIQFPEDDTRPRLQDILYRDMHGVLGGKYLQEMNLRALS